MKFFRPGDMDEHPPEDPKEERDGCGRVIAVWTLTLAILALIAAHA